MRRASAAVEASGASPLVPLAQKLHEQLVEARRHLKRREVSGAVDRGYAGSRQRLRQHFRAAVKVLEVVLTDRHKGGSGDAGERRRVLLERVRRFRHRAGVALQREGPPLHPRHPLPKRRGRARQRPGFANRTNRAIDIATRQRRPLGLPHGLELRGRLDPGAGADTSTSALTRSGATAATRNATAPPKEFPTSAARSIASASSVSSTSVHGACSPSASAA